MPDQINLPKDKELAKQVLDSHNELTHKKVEQGFLGRIWGSSKSIPNNLAALLIVVLLVTGVGYTFLNVASPESQSGLSIKDLWAIIIPLITLAIGYLFGEKANKDES